MTKGRRVYSVATFLKAIPGSGGLVTRIAQAVGCTWHTAKRWIDKSPTLTAAYNAEVEAVADIAEAVLVDNIKLARALQEKRISSKHYEPVDTTDVRWYLARKGKHRGYTERTEVTGADGDALAVRFDWTEVILEDAPDAEEDSAQDHAGNDPTTQTA